MRLRPLSAGGEHDVVEARRRGARGLARAPRAAAKDCGYVSECDHVARALGFGWRAIRSAGGGLAGEGRVAAGELDPAREGPGDAGARQGAQRGVAALAEDQHVEARLARTQRVRATARLVHDAILAPHLVGLALLPQ